MRIQLSTKDVAFINQRIKEAHDKDMLLDYETWELIDRPMKAMTPHQRDMHVITLEKQEKNNYYRDSSDRDRTDYQPFERES